MMPSDPIAIAAPTRAELLEVWKQAYGRLPPNNLSTRLLRFACDYDRQVQEQEGLRKSTLRKLKRYVPVQQKSKSDIDTIKAIARPTPGTRLVREWRGQTHIVDIGDAGFQYQGTTYKSLSAIARTITGARWSGPRFFGL